MNYTLLPPDGIVKGSIDHRTGTKADLWLNLSSYDAAPTGAFYSTIQTQNKEGHTNSYSISSNCPIVIKTTQTGGVRSVKANFANTITFNPVTNEVIEKCRASFTAVQTQPGTWTGALTVVYPDDRKLTVHGQFLGSVTVNREITGTRDNSCVAPGT